MHFFRMRNIVLLNIVFASSITSVYAQNIYSALQHDRSEEVRNKVPLEIIEENTFHNSNEKEVHKNRKRLNKSKKVVVEERFSQEGKIGARITYTYDSTGMHSLTRKFERWTDIGYSSETAFYEYDANWFLITVTDQTDKGSILQQAILTNNENGHPVKLQFYDENGSPVRLETAVYDYGAKKVYTEVLNRQGISVLKDTLAINTDSNSNIFFDLKNNTKNTYNKRGDILQSTEYSYEYEYDHAGNWITMRVFKFVQNDRKIDRVFKRKFKYPD